MFVLEAPASYGIVGMTLLKVAGIMVAEMGISR